MERHIAKRLALPCAVISAPVHVQDFPARHSPQMGFEGANVIFDTWVHPLVMGLEEHLLTMFRDDFEFSDAAGASHLGGHSANQLPPNSLGGTAAEQPGGASHGTAPHPSVTSPLRSDAPPPLQEGEELWTSEAESELKKIPFFVRGKARRNTENYAAERNVAPITLDTLYEAKAHYAR